MWQLRESTHAVLTDHGGAILDETLRGPLRSEDTG